jgi:hypothetical protein
MTFLQIYTLVHTALSIVAIMSGLLVVKGLIASAGRQLWTFLFFVSAWATTVTGFFFPFQGLTPAFILGLISLVPLALIYLARYRYRLTGAWRGTYVVSTVLVFYFNCFVLVVQSFQHVPTLNALAPTQTEPSFHVAQVGTFLLCLVAAIFSFRNYFPKFLDNDELASYISPRAEVE